jgi:hypothetical protein
VKIKDLPGWPPKWKPIRAGDESSINERGILRTGRDWKKKSNSIELAVEHEGKRYWGILLIDSALREPIVRIFAANLGRTVKEIADIEISQEEIGSNCGL